MTKDELFTLANFMSFVRIFLAAPIFYYISIHDNSIAIGFVILAMVTDWLDGYFARKWNQITTVGKVLDPFADKVCTTAGFLSLTIYQGLPVWITVVIIGRDIIITLASLVVIGKKNIVLSSNIPGKLTIFLITVLGIVYLLDIEALKYPVIMLAAVFILISLTNYAIVFFRNFLGDHEQ